MTGRATFFGYMSSISYVVALLGPAMAAAAMSISIWLPFGIGIILLLLAIAGISRVPATPIHAQRRGSREDGATSLPLFNSKSTSRLHHKVFVERVRSLCNVVASHPRNLTLLLVTFLLTALASSDTKLLVQYISKRYRWAFASVGYLLSGKAVVNFTLLAVVIPRLLASRRRTRGANDDADKFNLRYSKACLFISIAGALMIAAASSIWLLLPGLFVYAIGSALPVFMLSLLKSPAITGSSDYDVLTPGCPDMQIFSIVMLVKTMGSLIGAPLMATLWFRGIAVGGGALGIPYFVSAACYVAAVAVISCIEVA